jgi:hypothetical protein
LEIPPFLDIICANWGGLDITSFLRAQIGLHQTLQLDTDVLSRLGLPDPWPEHRKTIAVLYQYGNDPMQLRVIAEGRERLHIHPNGQVYRNHFLSSRNGPAANITVLAAIWGLQPVSEVPFIQAAVRDKRIPCNNTFFGRDGWGGFHKTCQTFLQNSHTGEVICVAGREGSTLALPTVWPGEDEDL